MTIWDFYLIAAFVVMAGFGFIWIVLSLHRVSGGSGLKSVEDAVDKDVEHIFSDDFRQELKNRGLLHFEKIINDNAEFLQQDLRLTSSQLNELMKTEITKKLQEEFTKYEQSINDARDLAIESIKTTNEALEGQRRLINEQIQKEIDIEKARIIGLFEKQLKQIVAHYVITAIGNQIDLSDQLQYILDDFENNKQAMIEDLKNA